MSETFSGPGTLIVDGTEHPCQYHLDIYEDRRLKSGSGFVVSTPSALWAGFNADKCSITMSDGRSFPIIINSYSPGNGDAAFKMAGGFLEP